MKKIKLIFAAAMLLALTACGNKDNSSDKTNNTTNDNTQESGIDTTINLPSTTEASTTQDTKTNYDIQTVLTDALFVDIIDGKEIPAEVIFGRGGEDGYDTFSTKDQALIKDLIEALRVVKIKNVITNPDEMVYICDANNDIVFIMKDGREVLFAFDLFIYVHENNVEYELENTEPLRNACLQIQNMGETEDDDDDPDDADDVDDDTDNDSADPNVDTDDDTGADEDL
ncbi:MAG: hypothetical protein IJJ74_05685 [Eubacterium sp.]|nr:hypothetical protein [Eubacterium sp.]